MIFETFKKEAQQLKGTVVFAEGDEERTLEAAVRLQKDAVCAVVVVALAKEKVHDIAAKKGLDITGLRIVVPAQELLKEEVLHGYIESRAKKNIPETEARAKALDPLHFSALYVKSGYANGCVAGARSSTSDVLRAALQGIGPASDTKLISSFFLMIPPAGHPLVQKPLLYADCGVNPSPNTLGLKDIAIASVRSFKSLFPHEQPKIAFLSFSTKGSAEHRTLDKVKEACELTKTHFSADATVQIDGELQFDAAIVPMVGQKKAPGSPVAGQANIFIFPDLNAGNISYKITERLGQFTAVGPVVQGLEKPFNDLSRGCSPDDIYFAALITLLQSAHH